MNLVFQFNSLVDLLNMSGHGPYVWASYIITFAGIAGLAVSSARTKRQFFKNQQSILRRQAP